MSRRGRPVTPGPAAAEGPAQGRVARAQVARPLSVAARFAALRVRVVLAVAFLVAGKLAQHHRAASSTSTRSTPWRRSQAVVAVPVALIIAYGVARVMSQGFNELRNAVFAKVSQRAVRAAVAVGVPPHPCAVAALSSGAAHRRAGARRRARHRRHRVPAVVHAVQRRADDVRDPRSSARSCGGSTTGPSPPSRLTTIVALHRLHLLGDRLAGALSPRDERAQQRGQHQGGRQPAQLRDGQIFRQRGARGRALRPRALQAYEQRRGQERDDPGAAQYRPGRDHRASASSG